MYDSELRVGDLATYRANPEDGGIESRVVKVQPDGRYLIDWMRETPQGLPRPLENVRRSQLEPFPCQADLCSRPDLSLTTTNSVIVNPVWPDGVNYERDLTLHQVCFDEQRHQVKEQREK